MKRDVFYIMLGLIFFMGSCKEDNDIPTFDLKEQFVVSSDSYSTLDNVVSLDVIGFNVTSVDVTHLGGTNADGDPVDAPKDNLGTITIVNGKGSLSVVDTDLGQNKIDFTSNLKFTAISSTGINIVRKLTLTVIDPIAITTPTVNQSTEVKQLKFEVTPVSATVTGVTIKRKVGKFGTYIDESGTFADNDSLSIKGSDFNVKDTVYYLVTASTSLRTASKSAKIIIGSNYTPVTVKLDTLALTPKVLYPASQVAYDLLKKRFMLTSLPGDSTDIAFTQSPILGRYELGFIAKNNAKFVQLANSTDDEKAATAAFYALGDKAEIEATDFTIPNTAFPDVAVGDVFVFRTKRGAGDYSYGIFKITKVFQTAGEPNDSYIEFELKYY